MRCSAAGVSTRGRHGEGPVAGLDVHRDVVRISAVNEETVHRHRAAVGDRHKRSIRPRIRKDDDDDGRASRPERCRQQLGDDFAELFEAKRHFTQLPGGDIANNLKVIRAKSAPLGRCVRWSRKEQQRQEQDCACQRQAYGT